MEPQLPSPRSNYERPLEVRRGEELPGSGPERHSPAIEQERPREQAAEAEPRVEMPPQDTTPAPIISLPTPVPIADNDAASDDDTPLTAADEDLIEKEWVDKAKKIIIATKDDPYRREQEVGKLQAEYLKKRYGKEIGMADA